MSTDALEQMRGAVNRAIEESRITGRVPAAGSIAAEWALVSIAESLAQIVARDDADKRLKAAIVAEVQRP